MEVRPVPGVEASGWQPSPTRRILIATDYMGASRRARRADAAQRRVRRVQLGEEIRVNRQLRHLLGRPVPQPAFEVLRRGRVAPDCDAHDRLGERRAVRGHTQVLRKVRANRDRGRVELRAGHLAIEIAIEPQQQIDIVQGQPNDRVDDASIRRVLRVADAVRVR